MKNFKLEKTTMWDFPIRGSWSTHNGDYRGNWAPQVPRNLILKYSQEEDLILDGFVGSGTTLIECRLLNRNAIGVDINPKAIEIAGKRTNFVITNNSFQKYIIGSSKNLHFLADKSIDFICTHPPYANIINYSNAIEDDLSNLSYSDFISQMFKVSKEYHRVLKHNKYCAIMIGDMRKNGKVIPLGFMLLNVFLNTGFTLKEIIIKKQNNCYSTKFWEEKSKQLDFYLLAHEYIFVLLNK